MILSNQPVHLTGRPPRRIVTVAGAVGPARK